MDGGPIVVEDRVVLSACLRRIDRCQLEILPVSLRILVIQPPQPDPVVFAANREYVTQRLPDMKPKTTRRAPVCNRSPSICITASYANFPFIPWLGGKRICIIQEFIVLGKPPGRYKGRVPDIITTAHTLGISI